MLVFQIQNADDVLITPLEKFRKEQIGAAKVRDLHTHGHILAHRPNPAHGSQSGQQSQKNAYVEMNAI